MKTKMFVTIIIALMIGSCSPAVTVMPTQPSSLIPSPTLTSVATLLPTLTPAPTSTQMEAAPTTLYASIELSPADNEAYQKALSDIPHYRQGDIQIKVQDESRNPLSG